MNQKKNLLIGLFILFAWVTPLKFGLDYVISLGTCIVDYGSEWGQITLKTAKCAWDKATLKGVL